MTARRPGPARIAMFGGGRGGAGIARHLLRTPGVRLALLVNGYGNGPSAGALRRFLPGMLGPSAFRRNLLPHLDPADPEQAALQTLLGHRLPAGAAVRDLDELTGALAARETSPPGFAALPRRARTAITRDLTAFLYRLKEDPEGLDLAACVLGDLVFAGAYLRTGEDFNAAVRSCARTFATPARLLNVTDGGNAHLVALKENGRLLADEADIAAPQDAARITDLFLLRRPLGPAQRDELETLPVQRIRWVLARHRAAVSPDSAALDALADADLIVYGPGTPHSSLLPSYLTPGVAEGIAANRAAAKVFVVNIREDHDVQDMSAPAHVDLALAYLGDPGNERRTVTHAVCHRPGTGRPDVPAAPAAIAEASLRTNTQWIIADLADPGRPGARDRARTADLLTGLASGAALESAG
ncbi:2-phospho-L-lactate transferase CofD family protein [Actinomadura sp. WMMA1423]|uniref:2-phospho-L-lactate transferase CofD family protein n=1 Tax=Actinomadura sp. WMMA1423 TaxID=2591108 RepID=UPI001F0F5D31|nr:2-phospho-L-lactate transferase CofD family protein [Actinomadura sp. WMMA1423]